MKPAAAAEVARRQARRRAWESVLIVVLLHLALLAVLRREGEQQNRQRLSEITIELGGMAMRGAGGDAATRPAEPVKPPQTQIKQTVAMPVALPPTPARTSATDELPATAPAAPALNEATRQPEAAHATSEQSAMAGVPNAAATEPDYKARGLNNPKPPYPPLALQLSMEGTVMIKALVRADGSCAEVLLARSSGNDLLDQSALRTVAQWRFVPARSQGQDISQWVSIPIHFALKRR